MENSLLLKTLEIGESQLKTLIKNGMIILQKLAMDFLKNEKRETIGRINSLKEIST